MTTTLPQRQGIRTRQIFYPEGAGLMGQDPGAPVGYLMPLADEAGFGSDQGLIEAPVFKGTRKPYGVISGNVNAAGENPYGLEFRTFPRIFKSFVGPDGYVRPGGGTTSLHRFFAPTDPDAEPGSCQIQDESLETPVQIIRNRGVRAGSINLAYANEGVARYGVGFMGIGDEVYTDLGGTVTDDGYRAVSYFNGHAKLNGYYLVGMTDFSVAFDGGASRQEAAFRNGLAASINYGAINITGRLGLMFATNGLAPENNMNFYNMAVNQQDVPLEVAWSDAPASLADFWCRLILPANRFSRRGFRPGGAAGKTIVQDYRIHDSENNEIAAEKFNTIRGPYTLTAADNVLGVKLNGGATIAVTLGTGSVTAAAIVAALNADVTFAASAEAEEFMGRVMIRTLSLGSAATVQIDTAQANSAHTVMGFDNVLFSGYSDTAWLLEVYNDITTDL